MAVLPSDTHRHQAADALRPGGRQGACQQPLETRVDLRHAGEQRAVLVKQTVADPQHARTASTATPACEAKSPSGRGQGRSAPVSVRRRSRARCSAYAMTTLVKDDSPLEEIPFDLHISVGSTLLTFLVLRIAVRLAWPSTITRVWHPPNSLLDAVTTHKRSRECT